MTNTEIDLHGKNVLVTGASMGIGYAAATACLRAGARITICARTPGDVREAVKSLEAIYPDRVCGAPADVTDIEQLDRVIDLLELKHGPLNAVIHSAGIYGPIGKITQVEPAEWFDAVRVNLFGTFLVARQAALRLTRNGGGRMVFFSGGGAAMPFPHYTAYSCGKIAIARLVETLAIEFAPYKIELNCISPGFVATRLHEHTLAAGPEHAGAEFFAQTLQKVKKDGAVSPDVGAHCAAFLISDAAAGITGRFVAAPYDKYRDWVNRVDRIKQSDFFTLRRIVPKDRGEDWQ